MLVTCPHCGKDADVSLATRDEAKCGACGEAFPLEAEAKRRLDAARQELDRVATHERKLGAKAMAVVDRGFRDLRGNARVMAGLSLLLFAGGALNAARSGLPNLLWLVAGGVAGALGATGAVLLAERIVLSARAAVLAAFAPRPPPSPGGDTTCHLCGAPLPRADLSTGRVECRCCKADNLFSDEAVAALGRARERDVTAHAKEMSRAARGLATATKVAAALVLLGVPAVGIVSFAVVGMTVKSAIAPRTPARR